jgi:hypothetical protein
MSKEGVVMKNETSAFRARNKVGQRLPTRHQRHFFGFVIMTPHSHHAVVWVRVRVRG